MALTDEAIDRIKGMIVRGELKPGDRLPKEADLADTLGLSRNSLREAIKALAMVRVLEVRQGAGTYVTSLEPALLLDSLAFVLDLQRDESLLAQVEVRRILEPAATAMAAYHMRDEEIAKLRDLLDVMEQTTDPQELTQTDLEFHRLIAVGSGNAVLASLVDSLAAPALRARIWRDTAHEGAVHRVQEQHRAIYNSLAARQAEVARSWATTHIAAVEDWLRRLR